MPTNPMPTNPMPTNPMPTSPMPTNPMPTSPMPTNPMPTSPMPTSPMPTSSSTSLVVCEPTLLDTILGYLKDRPWIVALLIIVIGCGIIYNQKTKERELDNND